MNWLKTLAPTEFIETLTLRLGQDLVKRHMAKEGIDHLEEGQHNTLGSELTEKWFEENENDWEEKIILTYGTAQIKKEYDLWKKENE